jgi:DNA-binding transcriptional MerR regulator
MEDQSTENSAALDEPMIDRAFIGGDIGVTPRTLRDYQKKGRLPPPDANLLGRDLWRLSTYRRFKADLLAGKFAMIRRLPHLRDAEA